ncbi:MAG: biosynthetic-type acetolactate synthase large subunit [Candidatus Roizmanbacteria bacterium]|nr:biosynthetic-type acetolactate synthase large subunit [Candidatus Roizmanbacteria bacterium]
MKLSGSQAVIESLLHENVSVIFGYPGGAIMPIYDALYDYTHSKKIRHILVRHEQGAGHAAEGWGRMTGEPGVVFATSGPGATNLVTALGDAMMDTVPMVCVTGQVHSSVIGTDAFQEADVIGVTAPVTKWSYQITQAEEIPSIFKKAFHIARTGRPGPVLIDITKDAQFGSFDFEYPSEIQLKSYNPTTQPHMGQIKLAAELLNNSKRPLILAGHGIHISKAHKELFDLAEAGDIPVALTLHGLSSFPNDHRLYAGFLGMHGNYGPNFLSNKADVVLAVGMRFDDRVTGRVADYLPDAKIIHIDIDPAELNKIIHSEVPIVADAKPALVQLLKYVKKQKHTEWVEEFHTCNGIEKTKIWDNDCNPKKGAIKMAEAVSRISEATKGNALVVSDVGQHQMIVARYFKFKILNSFHSSGGMGTMGYGLPAAMGVKTAAPDKEVISISGDGGFQMNIQELGTIAQEHMPIKIVILNNGFLGMVRQWQELFFDKRYSMVHMQSPDFIAVAKAYGIEGMKVKKREELAGGISKMLQSKDPFVLEISVEQEDNVFPMVASGASVADVQLE